MMGQNSFSNTFINNSNGTNPAPATVPAVNLDQPARKKFPVKTLLIILASALVGAGITTAIFLLFINRSADDTGYNTEIQYASPDNDGTQAVEDTIKEFDDEIAAASDESAKFSLTINKVGYYILNDDYDSALTTLNSIDLNSLDDDDKYIVYNHYMTAYEGKGDTTQSQHYKELADTTLNQAYANE